MQRARLILVIATVAVFLSVGAVAHAQGEAPARDAPAVEVGEPAPADDDPAWTFRFLVPTLLALSAAGLGLTALAYGRSVKGRYRVAR